MVLAAKQNNLFKFKSLKNKCIVFFYYTFIFVSVSQPAFSQKFLKEEYYSFKDYQSLYQIWDIEQDSNKYMYFGNWSGFSIFDGLDWTNIHIGETGRGTSLFKSQDGNFYASGQYDFGKLSIDTLNQVIYKSISENFYSPSEPFNEHFSTLELDSLIYFYGWRGVDLLKDNRILKFPFSDVFPPIAFKLKEKVFVANKKGIYEFENGEFVFLKSSQTFANDTTAFVFATPTSDDKILLGHKSLGLYYFNGTDFKEFVTEVYDEINKGYLYDGIQVNDTTYALATLRNGLFLINNSGNKVKVYNERIGLADNMVLDLFLDHEKTLWVGLNEGVQKITLNSPINSYDESDGINHVITDIEIVNDKIWVSSFKDITRSIILKDEKVFQFRLSTLSGSFFSWENEMYVFDEDGVFKINSYDSKGSRIIKGQYDFRVTNFDNPETLILSTSDSLLEFNNFEESILSFQNNVEFKQGVKKDSIFYFLSTQFGVFQLENKKLTNIPFDTSLNTGLLFNKIGVINDEIYVGTEGTNENGGLYKLNKDSSVFEKAKFFGVLDRELVSKQVLEFEQCENGDVWFQNNKVIKRATEVNGEWEVQRSPYQMIGNYNAIYKIHCEGDDIWFGGVNGLYQLTNPDWDYKTDFKTNITGIYVNNDSLIYGGFGEPVIDIVLPYEDNELRFTYAAASYIEPQRNTYSYKLEGFDRDWSEWSLETQKDYTNIPEGDYVFKIRSRNIYEVDGREDRISFSVLPPWYRTWWAYVLYLVLVTLVFYSIYKVRINQLLKVERMRTKIASDLHDEVSATLTGISYFAEALSRDKKPSKKDHFISLIIESAGDAKEKITDIVWSINPDNDDWGMFLSKCRRYASDLLESKDIKYDLKIADKIPGKLPMEVRQHLWMIYKEMLTNAVRHSNASRLDIIMDVDGRYLKLIVQDNGKGIKEIKEQVGNGVQNIKRRANLINANIEVDSEKGYGTRWKLIVPLE